MLQLREMTTPESTEISMDTTPDTLTQKPESTDIQLDTTPAKRQSREDGIPQKTTEVNTPTPVQCEKYPPQPQTSIPLDTTLEGKSTRKPTKHRVLPSWMLQNTPAKVTEIYRIPTLVTTPNPLSTKSTISPKTYEDPTTDMCTTTPQYQSTNVQAIYTDHTPNICTTTPPSLSAEVQEEKSTIRGTKHHPQVKKPVSPPPPYQGRVRVPIHRKKPPHPP